LASLRFNRPAARRFASEKDRAEKQKTIPNPQTPEPDKRVVWAPEKVEKNKHSVCRPQVRQCAPFASNADPGAAAPSDVDRR